MSRNRPVQPVASDSVLRAHRDTQTARVPVGGVRLGSAGHQPPDFWGALGQQSLEGVQARGTPVRVRLWERITKYMKKYDSTLVCVVSNK